jgi:hypothetical protein
VVTAYQRGWAELDNGALLRSAELEFDVFITTDKNLRFQQNVSGYRIAILVLPSANGQFCGRSARKLPQWSKR